MQIKAIIDRFESEKAVLLIGDSEIVAVWPRSYLPVGSREGDILLFAVSTDKQATKEARAAAEQLLKQLIDRV